MEILKNLWDSCFLNQSAPPDFKSDDWKSVGFQGRDPTTDLRGGGVVSLYAMAYFYSNYKIKADEILAKDEEYLLFSTVGANLSFALINFFHF